MLNSVTRPATATPPIAQILDSTGIPLFTNLSLSLAGDIAIHGREQVVSQDDDFQSLAPSTNPRIEQSVLGHTFTFITFGRQQVDLQRAMTRRGSQRLSQTGFVFPMAVALLLFAYVVVLGCVRRPTLNSGRSAISHAVLRLS